jgi:aminoglycoside phosphotransferase (APT) family kinase protein
MDVHAGNIVHTKAGLRLIDWEYAGDGDIALELAAVWIAPQSIVSWSPHMPGGRASMSSCCGGRSTLASVGHAADGGLV